MRFLVKILSLGHDAFIFFMIYHAFGRKSTDYDEVEEVIIPSLSAFSPLLGLSSWRD